MIKIFFKRLALVICFIITLPLIALTRLEELLAGRDCERVYECCKELLAPVPSILGSYLRLAFYKGVCSFVSADASFLFGSMLAHRDVSIGKGTVVGVYSIVGKADVGDNVLIGARVSLLSGKYQHGRPTDRVSQNGSEEFTRIKIGSNTWIGEQAVVMANVGPNCTISAGAVLYKDAPDNSTMMGNPARKVNM